MIAITPARAPVSVLVFLAASLLLPRWVPAAEDSAEIVGLRVGLAGCYKVGLWTPVEVVLRGHRPAEGQLALTVPDGDGVPTRIATAPDQPCRVRPGEETSVLLYARLGRAAGSLAVEFRDAEGPGVQRSFEAGEAGGRTRFRTAASSKGLLVAVVGRDAMALQQAIPGAFVVPTSPTGAQAPDAAAVEQGPGGTEAEQAGAERRPPGGDRATVVRMDDLAQLPTQWYGYEGIDVVVLSTSRPEVYAGLKAGSPRIAALEQWVRLGGTLVLAVGGSGGGLLAEGGPLAGLAPGKFQKSLALRQTGALETYCGSRVPVSRPRGGDLRVCQLAEVRGTVEVRDGTLALVVRRALGFGQVVFAAFDLDEPPLRNWPDRGAFMAKLLDLPRADDDRRQSSAMARYGYDDLAGQLRSALDQFPQVRVFPFWGAVAILVAYLLVIGPCDYFLLRKLVGRMVLTWVTFPLVVIGFCVAAYGLAHWLKGDRIRVNQVDLVDVDVETGEVRGTSWANLFSPKADRYDLGFAPRGLEGEAAADARVLTAWLGLPGEGLGGMSPKTAAPAAWRQPYDLSPTLDRMKGVPIQVWSTKSLTARWNARTPLRVEAELYDRDRSLEGSVRNALSFPLQECLLCYGRWAYDLGTLGPGQSAQLGLSVPRRDLNTFLTGRRLLLVENRELNTPYERSSVDAAYVLRAMMFFKDAGGYQYTGLANRYQAFVDLSDLLRNGRAVLVAKPPAEAGSAAPRFGAALWCNGRTLEAAGDGHTTVYRFVFPVKQPGGSG
jgi:hypothetical protein